MNKTANVIKILNSVSSDLHDLTLGVVFSKTLLDDSKKESIFNIKKNICSVSDSIDKIYVSDYKLAETLSIIVDDCISSLHEIHNNLKQDLIRQNAEDDYAELSAQIGYLKHQIEKIKDS